MDHDDHVRLLRKAIKKQGGIWADLGSGRGAFTLALADLIGDQGIIYSVDRDESTLQKQAHSMKADFPDVKTYFLAADFNEPLDLPLLDGIIMANALHFQRDQKDCLHQIIRYLKPGGKFVIIEYNIHNSNPIIPYPLPYQKWQSLAGEAGLASTHLLTTRPSRTLVEIYAAMSRKPR